VHLGGRLETKIEWIPAPNDLFAAALYRSIAQRALAFGRFALLVAVLVAFLAYVSAFSMRQSMVVGFVIAFLTWQIGGAAPQPQWKFKPYYFPVLDSRK